MNTKFIGLSGKKGCGKNTVGEMIKESLSFATLYALADPIKEIAISHFGVPADLVNAPNSIRETYDTGWRWENVPGSNKTGPITIRQLLQFIGTELFRNNFDNEFWNKLMLKRGEKNQLTIITDVRFPNEVRTIKEAGGIVVRIYGGNTIGGDQHPSEVSLDMYDAMADQCKSQLLYIKNKPSGSSRLYKIDGHDFDFLLYNTGDLESLECTVKNLITRIH
jgi:hypothetical protein